MTMAGSSTSHGLQAHDIIPVQIQEDYGDILQKYLPGWKSNAEYNYDIRHSTAIGASQLGSLKHLGPHSGLNTAIADYIDEQA